jgi:hypothetical protein
MMSWYKKSQVQTIKLWLDDERDPKNPQIQQLFGAEGDEIWVKTASEAIQKIQTGNVSYVSLDHDLGPVVSGAGTGYEVAKFIEKGAFEGTVSKLTWHIHSQNASGAMNMLMALKNADRYWERRGDQ